MSLFLYEGNGQVTGPHARSSLMARLAAGELGPDVLAAPEGTDDWRPLGDVLGYRPVKPQPQQAPAQSPPPQPAATNSIRPVTDLAQLRAATAYPFIRLLANVTGILGVVGAAALVLLGLLTDLDGLSTLLIVQAALIAVASLIWRELLHLGADIGDRLHQAGRR